MILKLSFNVIKGMRLDISPSKANPEYVFDARNIRLTARDGNTLLSISNEKGNTKIATITGEVKGYCVLGLYLVTFSRLSVKVKTGGGDLWGKSSLSSVVLEDYICRTYKALDKWVTDVLYYTDHGELNFINDILTLGIFENNNIQKVYWVDGINQPRVINIVKDVLLNKSVEEVRESYNVDSFDFVPTLNLKEKVTVTPSFDGNGRFPSGVILYAFTYYNKYGLESNIFHTSDLYYITYPNRGGSPEEAINTSFKLTIKDLDSPKFDYIRVYSIHRSSINATPYVKRVIDLPNYSTDVTYGITPNQSVYFRYSGVPQVSIDGGNTYKVIYAYNNYFESNVHPTTDGSSIGSHAAKSDYYRFPAGSKILLPDNTLITSEGYIYVTLKTGVSGPGDGSLPIIVSDLSSTLNIYTNVKINTDIIFTDNNTLGESIDPTLLLYIGGEDIVAGTLALKDNTLFLGNIKLSKPSIPSNIKQAARNFTVSHGSVDINIPNTYMGNHYKYGNLLSVGNTTTFKIDENYRLGIQFQYKNGKWSEPVLVDPSFIVSYDLSANNKPNIRYIGSTVTLHLPKLTTIIPQNIVDQLINLGFKRARTIVVNPSLADRRILLQGMVCPTVYTLNNRNSNTPYAQSSWFLRPFNGDSGGNNNYITEGAIVQNEDGNELYSMQSTEASSSSMSTENCRASEIEYMGTGNNAFKVSQLVLTFHSPDIEFDPSILTLDLNYFNIRLVGRIGFDTNVGDINIQTSSPTIGPKATGFIHKVISTTSRPARSLVSGFFYRDWIVDEDRDSGDIKYYDLLDTEIGFLVYPWLSSGSLNNDFIRPANKGTRSAVLKRKVISNIKTSYDNDWQTSMSLCSTNIGIFNSDEVQLLKLGDKNYYGNIDTLLYPSDEYSKVINTTLNFKDPLNITTIANCTIGNWLNDGGDKYNQLNYARPSVRMRYKSTPHIVFFSSNTLSSTTNNDLWSSATKPFLFLAEICRETPVQNPFGGTSDAALKANQWTPSGPSVLLLEGSFATLDYLHGDCWYLRYDCLKTYSYSNDDENSIIEIASFMVETRVNIDGRYDRNRGLTSNLNVSPLNFNLVNSIYSQLDNFFSYRVLDSDFYKLNNFQNSITWTKEKALAEEVDTWTNISMTNTLDVDGDLGKINSINVFNNELYCFLDKGISNILFNNRVLIPASDNVPIEISNGYKVLGKRYLSNSIGSQNWKSVLSTPNGIYFSDLYNSGLFLLNGLGILDISTPRGFTNWVKEYLPNRTYYDANNGDVYFMSTNLEVDFNDYKRCLCFSEKLNEFTSFMDYGSSLGMFNIGGSFFSLSPLALASTAPTSLSTMLFELFTGDYNDIYLINFPYSITYIANLDFTNDKIFNNVEFRADTLLNDLDSLIVGTNPLLPNICPFNKLTVWNEYLFGELSLTNIFGRPSSLKLKFRIWRANIPRDKSNNRDRIRNLWAYIKLEGSNNNYRMLLHDLLVYYYNNSIYGYGNLRL